VSNAVNRQFHLNLGNNPIAKAAASVNVRLALLGGGQYLLSQLDSAQADRMTKAESAKQQIVEMCK